MLCDTVATWCFYDRVWVNVCQILVRRLQFFVTVSPATLDSATGLDRAFPLKPNTELTSNVSQAKTTNFIERTGRNFKETCGPCCSKDRLSLTSGSEEAVGVSYSTVQCLTPVYSALNFLGQTSADVALTDSLVSRLDLSQSIFVFLANLWFEYSCQSTFDFRVQGTTDYKTLWVEFRPNVADL